MAIALKEGLCSFLTAFKNILSVINKIMTYLISFLIILFCVFSLLYLNPTRPLEILLKSFPEKTLYAYLIIWCITFLLLAFLNPIIKHLNKPTYQKKKANVILPKKQYSNFNNTIVQPINNQEQIQSIDNNFDDTFNNQEQQNNQNSNNDFAENSVFDPNSLKITKGYINSEQKLKELIGLDNVKTQIHKIQCKMEFDKKREKAGISCKTISNKHMCFYGPPGTGKTTVARIITGIFYNLGIIKENKCIEINGELLKGAYIGHTAIKTKAIIEKSYNGILFIDEAYLICDNEKNNGFGKEALGVILKEMEDNRDSLIVIFAGYEKEMNEFINMNSGLKSRIGNYIFFENYSSKELCTILNKMCKDNHYSITKEALLECEKIFNLQLNSDKNFGNGRFSETLLNKIIEQHALNFEQKSYKDKNLNKLTIQDIPYEFKKSILK